MDIVAEFLPLAEELIDNVFATPILYRRLAGNSYNPDTGEVTVSWSETSINAGVLNRSRNEEGGIEEAYQLTLWVHHGPTGLPFLPTTGDTVSYDSMDWKVTAVDPTYSSVGLIASKLIASATTPTYSPPSP